MTARDDPKGLRRLAEERLASRAASRSHDETADAQRLVHELQVHQIELELQNEELVTSRDEAEAGLRRYTALFDFAPIGYFVLAGDRTILQANFAGASLIGRERQRLVRARIEPFIADPRHRRAFADCLDAVYADGSARVECEVELAGDGDGRRCVHVTATAFEAPADTPAAALIAMQDVTERVRAEAALRAEQEERERLLVSTRRDLEDMHRLHRISTLFLPEDSPLQPVLAEIVEAGMAIAAADFGALHIIEPETGRVKVVAQRGFPAWWEELWDGEAGRGACGRVLALQERVIVEDIDESLLFAGEPERDMYRRAGVRAVVCSPLRTRSGATIGALTTCYRSRHRPDERALRLLDLLVRQTTDLLDRARAEAAERVLRARFEVLDRVTSALNRKLARDGGPVAPRDFLQDVVDFARAACDVEYAAVGIGEDPARPFEHWVYSGVSADLASAIGRTPAPLGLLGEVIRAGRSLRLPDLQRHPAFRGFPLHHPEMRSFLGAVIPDRGRPIGHLYLANKRAAREFTADDQKTLEMLAERAGTTFEIAELSRELRTAIHARENLLAVVSHDLRSPLSAVNLASSLLMELMGSDLAERPDVRKQIDVIIRATQRMRRLIDDLLQAAMIESGTFAVEPRREHLGELIDHVIAVVEHLATRRAIRIDRDVPALPPALCDRERVAQVLTNLIENALKFVPDHGTIGIRARAQADAIELAVSDDGPGIAPDDLEHLFDRYWKGQAQGRHGVGLGLFIARGIVEAQGGRLWVKSQLGRGTTFSFTIPIAHTAEPHAAP